MCVCACARKLYFCVVVDVIVEFVKWCIFFQDWVMVLYIFGGISIGGGFLKRVHSNLPHSLPRSKSLPC